MSILSLFHKVGAAYINDRSKKTGCTCLTIIGGIAKRKQSWARRVRTVACSYLVINSHKYTGATPCLVSQNQDFKNNSITNS